MAVTISRVYTKTGDAGQTALVGGKRIAKDAPRIEAYGAVDELNAAIGLVRHANGQEAGPAACREAIERHLARVQNELFNLGSLLATAPGELAPSQPRIEPRHTEALEREMDGWNEGLPTLRSFTLPGGGFVSSTLHMARTICRRAERRVVALAHEEAVDAEAIRYINRLSDALYVLGRWNARERGEAEPLWRPEST